LKVRGAECDIADLNIKGGLRTHARTWRKIPATWQCRPDTCVRSSCLRIVSQSYLDNPLVSIALGSIDLSSNSIYINRRRVRDGDAMRSNVKRRERAARGINAEFSGVFDALDVDFRRFARNLSNVGFVAGETRGGLAREKRETTLCVNAFCSRETFSTRDGRSLFGPAQR